MHGKATGCREGGRKMPSFLKDTRIFAGTGERNKRGQTLQEFLEEYDPYKYKTPSCTTDAVIFSYRGEITEGLKVLLIRRGDHPSIGWWALPGGFVNLEENLEDTARRELEEETGVKGLVMEQIGTFGDYDRDPRTRVITTAYMALAEEGKLKVKAGDDAADAAWCEVSWKLAHTRQQGEETRKCYELKLDNVEKGVSARAVVEERLRGTIVQERKLEVVSRDQIAGDHAAIIMQALLTLDGRLREPL